MWSDYSWLYNYYTVLCAFICMYLLSVEKQLWADYDNNIRHLVFEEAEDKLSRNLIVAILTNRLWSSFLLTRRRKDGLTVYLY